MKEKDYKLFLGDCLEVMKTLADNSIDLCLTDPPYGTTVCKWDSVIPFEPMWKELKRICKPKVAICLFGSQPFTSALVMSNPILFKHEWIWIKNAGSNFANTVREPMKEHESILVFSCGGWTYNKQMQERAESGLARTKHFVKYETASENYRVFEGREPKTISIFRVPSSWQKFNRERGFHPTQKPVELLRYLIRTYTQESETVLDFTMGSGSTGVACQLENRKFIGIEKDENYFEIATNRIESALNAQPLFATA